MRPIEGLYRGREGEDAKMGLHKRGNRYRALGKRDEERANDSELPEIEQEREKTEGKRRWKTRWGGKKKKIAEPIYTSGDRRDFQKEHTR